MSDALRILRRRLDDLIGPGKPFKSAPEMAQRASTMGLVESAPNFTRSINRVRKGANDVQLTTIEAIAKTANLAVSDLLQDDTHGPAKIAAELVSKLDTERAAAALAMLRGLATAPREKLVPKSDVVRLLRDMRNQLAHADAPPQLVDPQSGSGAFLLATMRLINELDAEQTAGLKSVRGAMEAWLDELLKNQKSVDTADLGSDATRHLINQTRAAARGKPTPESQRGSSADERSRQGPTVKHR